MILFKEKFSFDIESNPHFACTRRYSRCKRRRRHVGHARHWHCNQTNYL